ncbi:MAG TPA: surface-adhesin E family protein, partial [Azonexus sp.]|nr:surface-adhesin E family protein [Azonexus sp.]
MRLLTIAALLATLPIAAAAAPTWQTISSEPGKRIELDRTSIKRDGTTVQAQGRIVLEKELVDIRSGAGYRVIEALTRYDCASRNANTIRRIFKKNETQIVREEELKGTDLPVRSGTLDDKVLREVCRPPKESPAELAQKANEAAGQLKEANEALLKKEMAKAPKAGAVKTSDAGHGKGEEKSPIPSIKPNLRVAVEQPKAAPPPPPEKVEAPVKSSTVVVHTASSAKPRRPAARSEGYMLELA